MRKRKVREYPLQTFILIIGILILVESVWSRLIISEKNQTPLLQKIKKVNDKYQLAINLFCIFIFVAYFVLSEFEKKKEEISKLKQKNELANLKLNVNNYKTKLDDTNSKLQAARSKLNDFNSVIKNISLRYSVTFEIREKIYSESTILPGNTIFGLIGSNVQLKSSGVTFRFIDFGNGKVIVEANAALMDGDFPHGNKIDMLKGYKDISIYIPFFSNRNYDSFKVSNYSISLAINGVSMAPIVVFEPNVAQINGGPYSAQSKNFGTIKHLFKRNLYDDLLVKEKLLTY